MSDKQQEIGYFSEEAATFGDRVAAARNAAEITQEGLSRKLGIKLKTLRGWENNISEPRANKLQMLSGVLNVSLIWLLTGEGEGVPDPNDVSAIENDGQNLLVELKSIQSSYKQLGIRMACLEKRLAAKLAE